MSDYLSLPSNKKPTPKAPVAKPKSKAKRVVKKKKQEKVAEKVVYLEYPEHMRNPSRVWYR